VEFKAPVVMVGCKVNLLDRQEFNLEHIVVPIRQRLKPELAG